MRKTAHFGPFFYYYESGGKMSSFSHFSIFSAKQINKMHNITYFQDLMMKILTPNFWSQGTRLGSLGCLSQGDVILGSCRLQILVILGPYKAPVHVASQAQAKNLKTAGAQCDTGEKPYKCDHCC